MPSNVLRPARANKQKAAWDPLPPVHDKSLRARARGTFVWGVARDDDVHEESSGAGARVLGTVPTKRSVGWWQKGQGGAGAGGRAGRGPAADGGGGPGRARS